MNLKGQVQVWDIFKVDHKDVVRFISKVKLPINLEEDCWEWTSAKDKGGYGTFQVANNGAGEKHRAPRVSYAMYKGVWPTLFVLHTCNVTSCVNPFHLYEGTQYDNIRDQITAGTFVKGENNGNAILSNEDVLDIRKRLLEGQRGVDIAEVYKVSPWTVYKIKNGVNWRHI